MLSEISWLGNIDITDNKEGLILSRVSEYNLDGETIRGSLKTRGYVHFSDNIYKGTFWDSATKTTEDLSGGDKMFYSARTVDVAVNIGSVVINVVKNTNSATEYFDGDDSALGTGFVFDNWRKMHNWMREEYCEDIGPSGGWAEKLDDITNFNCRASSSDSTASFWSNMSVTNAISNISTSLSRVLSTKVSKK